MRRVVRYEPAGRVVSEPVTKLGGEPAWLGEPQWPLSRSRNRPMLFVGQFRLDEGDGPPRLAYVFMSDSEAFDADDENNDVEDDEDYEFIDNTFEPEGGENAVIVQPGGRVPSFVRVRNGRFPLSYADDHLPVDEPVGDGEVPLQFLGGEPEWLQFPQAPGPGWRFVAQLVDGRGENFGDAGVAYVFVSPDGAEGRFPWQCH